jgi:zinc protease
MSKRKEIPTKSTSTPIRLEKVKSVREITEYRVSSNGLRVLFAHRPGTGVVTSNILYLVGSRDEARGETGIAHMLEHMLFKPTTFDKKRNIDSASMAFEREYGVTLNANTWKDRTTYYFSYPKEHLHQALQIEAERIHDVILEDKEFKPEQTNVLSEYDMYAGDEEYSLAADMSAAAFQSHTYGHKTIGFREDIEAFTVGKLERFYRNFYTPRNAVLMLVGDVTEKEMRQAVVKHFGALKNSSSTISRNVPVEPKQEGRRTIEIRRPSKTNVFALGVKHEGFPSVSWFETMAIFDMLAGGTDSLFHKKLVDVGLVTRIDTTVEPTKDMNLAILFFTLAPRVKHAKVREQIEDILRSLSKEVIAPYLTKTIAKAVTQEFVSRENSLEYTAELVEYASAGAWEAFFDTEKVLRGITTEDILARIPVLFASENTTEGHFIGTMK